MQTVSESKSKVYGTNAERLAMNLGTTEHEFEFYETDTNSEYQWKGSEWVQISTNGAAHVTQTSGTWDYGPYPDRDWNQTTGTGVNDNDLLFTQSNMTPYSTHIIHSTAGTVDVEISIDGTNWTTSATDPIALEDAHGTTHGTYVATLTVGKVGIFRGKVSGIRVRQNGATAATAKIASY